jgi:hypothetical protein
MVSEAFHKGSPNSEQGNDPRSETLANERILRSLIQFAKARTRNVTGLDSINMAVDPR